MPAVAVPFKVAHLLWGYKEDSHMFYYSYTGSVITFSSICCLQIESIWIVQLKSVLTLLDFLSGLFLNSFYCEWTAHAEVSWQALTRPFISLFCFWVVLLRMITLLSRLQNTKDEGNLCPWSAATFKFPTISDPVVYHAQDSRCKVILFVTHSIIQDIISSEM